MISNVLAQSDRFFVQLTVCYFFQKIPGIIDLEEIGGGLLCYLSNSVSAIVLTKAPG